MLSVNVQTTGHVAIYAEIIALGFLNCIKGTLMQI